MSKSDVSRAFIEDGTRKTHIGGQALIEGIMMRGKTCWAVAVREPSGVIYTEERTLSEKRTKGWMTWPLVRGCVALVDSLVIGYKALEIAANHALLDEEEPTKSSKKASSEYGRLESLKTEADKEESTKKQDNHELSDGADNGADSFGKGAMALSLVLGLGLGVALFIFLPALVSNVLIGDYDTNVLAWNLIDGVARVAIFVFYVWLIGRMKDIKRMFSYHGAEHKTIHCYEHNLELTPENARIFPCLHVRCGTAFLIMVMIIAILIYTILPLDKLFIGLGVTDSVAKFLLVLLARIVLMPLIAGVSYEITVKWAGSHPENPLVKIILWPGMQMQRLTTNEPDDSQLECAIAAMNIVLENEKKTVNIN